MYQLVIGVNIPVGILFGILYTMSLNLGKGVQRLGAETLGKGFFQKWKTNPEERKKIKLWLIGTLLTAISAVISVVAQFFLDRPSTLVALGGIGILSVVIFASRVIKESINRVQIASIAIIVIGTAMLGFDYPEIAEKSLPNEAFIWYSIILWSAGVAMVFISMKTKKAYGIVFGMIAGFFNGFAAVATAFSTATGENEVGASLLNPWLLISILLGQGAFWATQYAFKMGGNANVVVPSMNSLMILIPFILDAFVYQVPFGPFQYTSFILNLAGVVMLSIASGKVLNRVMSAAPVIETPVEAEKQQE